MRTPDTTCFVALALLAGTLIGCSEQPRTGRTLGASGETLVEALRSGRADYISCAVSYLDTRAKARPAGLSVTPEEPASLSDWQAIAKTYDEWLMRQDPDERSRIQNAFPEYLETWSPYNPLGEAGLENSE